MNLHIYPLICGWVDNDIRTFDPGAESAPLRAPVLVWVASVQGLIIIFDTGPSDPEIAAKRGHTNFHQDPSEELSSQMHSISLRPDDVDAVVLSHLHWDHASNWELFPRAQIYVQAAELAYAARPERRHSRYYDTVADPPSAVPNGSSSAIDGESLVMSNRHLRLVPLPGHTPGSQGLLITAGRASILLAGDTVPLLGNLAGSRPRANGIATDGTLAQTTIECIPKIARDILPSHDPILTRFAAHDIVPHLTELRETWAPTQITTISTISTSKENRP